MLYKKDHIISKNKEEELTESDMFSVMNDSDYFKEKESGGMCGSGNCQCAIFWIFYIFYCDCYAILCYDYGWIWKLMDKLEIY